VTWTREEYKEEEWAVDTRPVEEVCTDEEEEDEDWRRVGGDEKEGKPTKHSRQRDSRVYGMNNEEHGGSDGEGEVGKGNSNIYLLRQNMMSEEESRKMQGLHG
jgi:hypothetical protein